MEFFNDQTKRLQRVAVASAASIARVNLKFLSMMTTTCWFPLLVLDSKPEMPTARNSKGPDGGNICRGRFRL